MKSTSQLISEDHVEAQKRIEEYQQKEVRCDFCLKKTQGISASTVINSKYFNDSWAKQKDDDQICCYCAACMKTKDVQRGHWHAHTDGFDKISSSDLYEYIENNDIGTGGFHVTSSPIKNAHAYLWTQNPGWTYDKTRVQSSKEELLRIIELVERLRANKFTLDEIRALNPKMRSLQRIGAQQWLKIREKIRPYKSTTLIEIAITASRSKSDQ